MAAKDVWSEHGLTEDEYKRIVRELGREPNRVELGICGALWSEHCSYKSSRKWLAKLPTTGPHVVQGPGENAGIVRLDGDVCLAFKIESHNHPSYIEPYNGAATGVGGIMRDVFTMGARPIANLNSLRFGRPDHPKTPSLLNGVVRGIADYGNCMGVPTVGGECVFSSCYDGNILVNAMTVGVVRESKIFLGYASGVGNPVFYLGSATGGDGIKGATMASASFEAGQEDQRPAVQVGDPFTEKLLLEACIELMDSGAVVGIQDMGAAGLTSSSFEMAARAGSGLDLRLDCVPMRQQGLGPYELMLSESQERMLVVLKKGKEHIAHEIFQKWDLAVAEIGTVTDTGVVRCYWHGELAAELPVPLLVDDAPKYDRAFAPNPEREARQARQATAPKDFDAGRDFLKLLAHPSLASKRWIYQQYDSTVQANTIAGPGGDAAIVWVPEAGRAVAITVEGNSRLIYLDPNLGTQHVVAEGIRNLACAGALPLGATDGLNFGNPQRPEYFWEFKESLLGMTHALTKVDTPIVGGNVSLYNETSGKGIWPTPMIGFVGKVAVELGQLPRSGWLEPNLQIVRLGKPAATLAGSAWQEIVANDLCGHLPEPDWHELLTLQKFMLAQIEAGNVLACRDIAEGGLLLTLAEMAFAHDIGFELDAGIWSAETLFGETGQNVLVATQAAMMPELLNAAAKVGLACDVIGSTGGDACIVPGMMKIPLAHAKKPWAEALPALVGETSS